MYFNEFFPLKPSAYYHAYTYLQIKGPWLSGIYNLVEETNEQKLKCHRMLYFTPKIQTASWEQRTLPGQWERFMEEEKDEVFEE